MKRFLCLALIGLCSTAAFAQRGGGRRGGGFGIGGGRTVGSIGRGGFSSGTLRGTGGGLGWGRGSRFGAGNRFFGGGFGRFGYGRYGGFRGYYRGWYPGYLLGFGLGYGYGFGYDPFYYGYPYYGSSYYDYPSYGYGGYAPPTVVINSSGYYGPNNRPAPYERAYEYESTRSGDHDQVRPPSDRTDYKPTLYLIALKDHNVRLALTYWIESGNLHYVTEDHQMKQVPLSEIDRDLSERLNRERHMNFRLPPLQ